MSAGIYEIRNTVNSNCYIGSSINMEKRWREHRCGLRAGKHHAIILQRAWDKHGEGAFTFRPLFMCAEDMLTFYEQRALDILNPVYNATSRAGSPAADPAIRMKISARLMGHVLSAETKAKISAAHKGRKQSSEAIAARVAGQAARSVEDKAAQRQKISASLKRVYQDPAKRIQASLAQRGRAVSSDTREKYRAYALNRPSEHNAKLSAAATARYAKLRKATNHD